MGKCPYAAREIEERCSTMTTWNDLDLTNIQLVTFSDKYCWNSNEGFKECPVYQEREKLEGKIKELEKK